MATGSSTAGLCSLCSLLVLGVLGSDWSVPAPDKGPVLVWTNDPSITFPQQFVGHSISQQEFQESYVKGLTSYKDDNVVWFIQDRLEAADFALFSDVFSSTNEINSFRHVKSLMSEMTSAYLPSVSSPASIPVEEETLNLRKVKTVHDPSEIKLESDDGPQMVIVKLPELDHSPKSFSEIDEIIGSVSLQLKTSSRPFIAFYAANSSSQDTSNLLSHRSGRWLRAARKKGSPAIFVNISDFFYLYATNFTISLNRSSAIVTGLEVDENMTNCEIFESDCVVVLKFSEISRMAIYNASIRFDLNTTEYGFWYLSMFSLEYWTVVNSSDNSKKRTIEFDSDFVEETPLGYSYHCSKLPPLTVKTQTGSSKKKVPLLKFRDFQMQAFVTKRGKFGHYNDCVGFFTPGIWMSIITSFILIAILFFGVIMMLNISTQDQFGSVHGGTLTITVSEG